MILDCFPFFNELDLLEVRVNTLAPYVDAFVLCEANRTFQGKSKPYIFDQHKSDVRFLCGKPILSIKADISPMDGLQDAWEREKIQRYTISTALHALQSAPPGTSNGLRPLRDDDRLILSDVDEIPDLRIFRSFDPANSTVMAWNQNLYYYWVNLRCWDWIGPVSCTWEVFHLVFDQDFQLLRDGRHKAECLIDGGWHFSFLGGPQAIKEKIEAFSHTEYRGCASELNIAYALKEGWKKNRDIFGRRMMHFERMPDDSHLPAYLVRNKERFKDWWLTDGTGTEAK